MDYQISQKMRVLLQTRFRRVKTSGVGQYTEQLRFLLNFIESDTIFNGVLSKLLASSSLKREDILNLLNSQKGMEFGNERDYVSAAYYTLKFLAETTPEKILGAFQVAASFAGAHRAMKFEDCADAVNDYWLEFLYDYLDESIDNQSSILGLIKKFKHSVEWFKRHDLIAAAESDGERGLALKLYEYLYNQGVEFHIEPQSASGRPDLIAEQVGENRIVLDAKHFKVSETENDMKTKIAKGFRQVFDYCADFDEPVGYMTIFNSSGKFPDIDCIKINGFSAVKIGSKTIFFEIIDIHDYSKSASQRGKLPVFRIAGQELVTT